MSCKTKADMMLACGQGSTAALKPSDTLGCSALLEAGMEPSHPVPLRLLHLFGSLW